MAIGKKLAAQRVGWVPFALCLSIFAVGIVLAFHYGRRGPGFGSHVFSTGWRIYSGQVPFVDFFLVQGLTPGLIQVPFFGLLGVTVISTIVHAAVVNGLAGVFVYLLLRTLNLDRIWSFFYGALTCVVFFPPWGHPFTNPYGYFFSLIILFLQLAALRSDRTGSVVATYAMAGVAAVLGFYSKPVPIGYFLPLSVVLLLFLKGRLKLVAAGAGLAGLLLALSPLAVIAGGDEAIWHRIWFYSVELPSGIGGSRLSGAMGLYAIAKTVASAYRFNMASFILLYAAIGVSLFLAARIVVRESLGALPRDAVLAFLVGAWVLAVTVLLQATSHFSFYRGMPLLFLSVGCLQHALCRMLGSIPVATNVTRATSDRNRAGLTINVVAGLFAIVAGFDGLFFNAMANAQRGWTLDPRIVTRVRDVSDIPGLKFLEHYTMEAKTGFGVFRRTADDVKGELAALEAAIKFLWNEKDNVFLVGPNPLAYAFAGEPEILPVITPLPGFGSPLRGTPEFTDFMRTLERNVAKYGVRRIVMSPGEARRNAEAIAGADGLVCGRDLQDRFYVLDLCRPPRGNLGNFLAVITGAGGPPRTDVFKSSIAPKRSR